MATLHFPFPHDGSFDPSSIQVMTDAFEEAWVTLNVSGVSFQDGGFNEAAVRERLAKCIIQMASAGVRDQQLLRDAALEHLAQNSLRNSTGQARLLTDEPCSPKHET
jgi:hypothetical protein